MPTLSLTRIIALLAIIVFLTVIVMTAIAPPAPARADDSREQARADLKRFLGQRQLSADMVKDDKELLEALCDKDVDVARALSLCKRLAESRQTKIHDALALAKASELRGEPLAAAVDAKADEK